MSAHLPIPADYEVQPLDSATVREQQASTWATCGHCGLTWDDAIITGITPAPSARCPFKPFHVYEEDEESETLTITVTLRMGPEDWQQDDLDELVSAITAQIEDADMNGLDFFESFTVKVAP